MNSRSLVFNEFHSSPQKLSFKNCDVRSGRFSIGTMDSINYDRKTNKIYTCTIDYNYKPVYKCTRPSIEALLENPGKYSREEKSNFYLNDDLEIMEEEEDKDTKNDDSCSAQYTSDGPDFLFGPLTSRIPKKRNIITTDEDSSPKRIGSSVKFDLNVMKNDEKLNGPPLRQLRDSVILSNLNRNLFKGLKNTNTLNYNEMSDTDFEKSCWLVIFGSSSESENVVLKHITDNIGEIKAIARKDGINYFYARMANPFLVRKACDMRVYFYSDKEIIGFTKPSSFDFLDNTDYVIQDLSKCDDEDNTNVPKKSIIRVVSMNTKSLSLRDEVQSKEIGLLSKLWSYVNK
uniref:Nucleoporin NUP53 n=1 Tax=Strongyloides venezuelensis TaxID=75913 RepID=A0A0K0F0G5_STRVS